MSPTRLAETSVQLRTRDRYMRLPVPNDGLTRAQSAWVVLLCGIGIATALFCGWMS